MNKIPNAIYPVEPWQVSETRFSMKNNYRNETVFALSNGFLGTRGTLEEGYDFSPEEGLEGMFINGFYDGEPIRYGECCYGFPATSQTLLNLPHAKGVTLCLPSGEMLDIRQGKTTRYRRVLHMDRALVTRTLEWVSPKGLRLQLETRRLVSLAHKRLMAQSYKVTPLNFSGNMQFVSHLQADVCNHTRTTNPLIDYGPYERSFLVDCLTADKGGLFVQGHTRNSGLIMACRAETLLDCPAQAEYTTAGMHGAACYSVQAKQGLPITLIKYIAYAATTETPKKQLGAVLDKTLEKAREIGFDGLAAMQRQTMSDFWKSADVVIEGNERLQQGLRFNLFHIMQASGRDGRTGMGAKGLSGEGYEGHYFWDTEMYILPVWNHTCPQMAKKLLDYRCRTLPKAKKRARQLGHPAGALYPWRTINGQEASAYYPLGTAQYHINADIAYAFWQYITVTGDMNYLENHAAEVLCETARVWADVGSFAPSRGGRYCICCVTGPDEYNALVDNNFYTNLMAREHLRAALAALQLLKEQRPKGYEKLVRKLGLSIQETQLWQQIADKMYLPRSEELGIYLQDDGYMQRKPWDESRIPPAKRHLLFENYHPLFVFRHQMSKQADTVLGLYLYDDLFDREELERNFEFYQSTTLHHSSLSNCVFGLLACRIGKVEDAAEYFAQSTRMDLDDYHKNFYAGIHAANMAGSWSTVANGFGGLRTANGQLCFEPRLPQGWQGYRFRVNWRGSLVECAVSLGKIVYTLVNGPAVELLHRGKPVRLKKKGEHYHEAV